MNSLCISFVKDFCPGFEFCFCQYAMFFKQRHRFRFCQSRNRIYHTLDIRKSSSFGFFHPLLRITIAIENDSFVRNHGLFYHIMKRHTKVFCFFQLISHIAENFCHDSI